MQTNCPSPDVKTTRAVLRVVMDTAADGKEGASLAKAIQDQLKRCKTILVYYSHIDTSQTQQLNRQANNLFEVQAFCDAHNFPQGLMKILFYELYELDIVFEDAYSVWREDLLDQTPGKMKALVQVREFLDWLDQAEQEEEEEDDE